jgi:hypothetical protein
MKKLFIVPILTLLFLFLITMAGAEWEKIQLTDNTKGENVGHIPVVLSLLLFSSEHTINGTVFGDVISGVTITLSGDASATTISDSSGDYSFAGLENGSYTATPGLNGYIFNPVSRSLTVSDDDETGIDFVAAEIPTYTISGTVDGDVQEGVTMTLSGDGEGTTTTDSIGDYSFSGLSNGSYIVIPSLSDYSFTPTSENIIVSDADETGVDFTAVEIIYTYSINGTVGGDVQEGVTVELSGDASATTTTDSSEGYSFSGLENGSYAATPGLNGYIFNPVSWSVTVSDDDETGVDFTATERLIDNGDGTVTDEKTGLVWLKSASCLSHLLWSSAISAAAGLNNGECGLSDGSSVGDWRLPIVEELQGIGRDSLGTWTMPGVPFVDVQYDAYWSSEESDRASGDWAWRVYIPEGTANEGDKDAGSGNWVWPVRSDLWAECAPGCYDIWIGDGLCDDVCNVAACSYDEGDCEGEVWCAPGCYDHWIGDGWCDSECYFAACSYDEGDCIGWCAPDCHDVWIGNGYCNDACNVAACNYDDGDC